MDTFFSIAQFKLKYSQQKISLEEFITLTYYLTGNQFTEGKEHTTLVLFIFLPKDSEFGLRHLL